MLAALIILSASALSAFIGWHLRRWHYEERLAAACVVAEFWKTVGDRWVADEIQSWIRSDRARLGMVRGRTRVDDAGIVVAGMLQ